MAKVSKGAWFVDNKMNRFTSTSGDAYFVSGSFKDTLYVTSYQTTNNSFRVILTSRTTGTAYIMSATKFFDILFSEGINGRDISGEFDFIKAGGFNFIQKIDLNKMDEKDPDVEFEEYSWTARLKNLGLKVQPRHEVN